MATNQTRMPLSSPLNGSSNEGDGRRAAANNTVPQGSATINSETTATTSHIGSGDLTLAGLRAELYGGNAATNARKANPLNDSTAQSAFGKPAEGSSSDADFNSRQPTGSSFQPSPATVFPHVTPPATTSASSSPSPAKYHPLSLNANTQIRRMSMHPSHASHRMNDSSASPLPKFGGASTTAQSVESEEDEGDDSATSVPQPLLGISGLSSKGGAPRRNRTGTDAFGGAGATSNECSLPFGSSSPHPTGGGGGGYLRSNESSVMHPINVNAFSFRAGASSLSPPGGGGGASAAPPFFNGALGAGGSLISNEVRQALGTLKGAGDLLVAEGIRAAKKGNLAQQQQPGRAPTSPPKDSPVTTSPLTFASTPPSIGFGATPPQGALSSTKQPIEAAGELITTTVAALTRLIEEQMVGLYKHIRNQHNSEKILYGWGPLETTRWDAKKGEWTDEKDLNATTSAQKNLLRNENVAEGTAGQPGSAPSSPSAIPMPRMSAANSLATFLYLQLEAAMHLTGATRGAMYLTDNTATSKGGINSQWQQQGLLSLPPSRDANTKGSTVASPSNAKSTYARRVANISSPSVTVADPAYIAKSGGNLSKLGADSATPQAYPHLSAFKPVTIPLQFPTDVPLAAMSTIATCIQHNIGINISACKYKVHSTLVVEAPGQQTNKAGGRKDKSTAFEMAIQQAAFQRELNVVDAIVLPFGDGTSNRNAVGCIVVADRKRQVRSGESLSLDNGGSGTSSPLTSSDANAVGFDLVDEQHVASLCTVLEAIVSRYGAHALLAASTEPHHHDAADRMLLSLREEFIDKIPANASTSPHRFSTVSQSPTQKAISSSPPSSPRQYATAAGVSFATKQLELASHIPAPQHAPSPASVAPMHSSPNSNVPPKSKALTPRQPTAPSNVAPLTTSTAAGRGKRVTIDHGTNKSGMNKGSGNVKNPTKIAGEGAATMLSGGTAASMLELIMQQQGSPQAGGANNGGIAKSRAGVMAPPAPPQHLLDNPPKALRRTVVFRISGATDSNKSSSSAASSPTGSQRDETLIVAKDVLASLEHWRKRNLEAIRSRPTAPDSRGGDGRFGGGLSDNEVEEPFASSDTEDRKVNERKKLSVVEQVSPSLVAKRPDNGGALAVAQQRQKEVDAANNDELMRRLALYTSAANAESTWTNQNPSMRNRRGSVGTSGASKTAIANSYPVHVVSKDALVGEVGELVSTMEVLWVRSLEKVSELKDELDAYDRKLLGKDEAIQSLELEVRRLNRMFSQLRSDVQKVRKAVPAHLADRYGINGGPEEGTQSDGTLLIGDGSPAKREASDEAN